MLDISAFIGYGSSSHRLALRDKSGLGIDNKLIRYFFLQ